MEQAGEFVREGGGGYDLFHNLRRSSRHRVIPYPSDVRRERVSCANCIYQLEITGSTLILLGIGNGRKGFPSHYPGIDIHRFPSSTQCGPGHEHHLSLRVRRPIRKARFNTPIETSLICEEIALGRFVRLRGIIHILLSATMQFALILLTLAGLCSSTYTIFEKISGPPQPWIANSNGHIDVNQHFVLWIHLKNQNRAAFHQKVFDAATPGHATYGQHLTRQQVEDFLAPEERAFSLVAQWLNSFQDGALAHEYTIKNDWYIVNTTLGTAMELLQADYHLYENTETGKTTVRTLAYSLPAELHPHVDMIGEQT